MHTATGAGLALTPVPDTELPHQPLTTPAPIIHMPALPSALRGAVHAAATAVVVRVLAAAAVRRVVPLGVGVRLHHPVAAGR